MRVQAAFLRRLRILLTDCRADTCAARGADDAHQDRWASCHRPEPHEAGLYWIGARQTVALQDIADRLIGNHISEIGQGPRNAETVPRPEYQDLRQTRPPCATLASADRRVTRPEETG